MKIEKIFPNNFSYSGLRRLKSEISLQYRARWETGDSIAVTSIQDRLFQGFSVPQLFFVCGGRKLFGQNCDWEWLILTTKQLRNRETSILTPVSHLARYCIPPGSEISHYYMPQMWGRKIDQGFCFSIFIREQNEDLIKQTKKKNVIYTL